MSLFRNSLLSAPATRTNVRQWRAPGQAMRGRREAHAAALHGPTEDKAARRPAAVSGVRGRGEPAPSYLSAGCPAPKGFPGATFPFAKASFAFAGKQALTSTLTRSCGARP